jgi:DNA-binding MarR family transcriptional regulator
MLDAMGVKSDSWSEMPVDARLGHAIKRAEQALMAVKKAVLSETGLTVAQYSALLVLAQEPGLSGAQMARRCLVTPQTMASVLATLATKGLIEREHSSVHSLVVVAHLTRSGHAVLRKADRLAIDVEQQLAGAFTAQEQGELRDLLERAAAALQAYEPRPALSTS